MPIRRVNYPGEGILMSFCCDEPSLFVPASTVLLLHHRERQINALYCDGRGARGEGRGDVSLSFATFYRLLDAYESYDGDLVVPTD